MTKLNLRGLARAAGLGAALVALAGCYYEPAPPAPAGYAYAPQPGYYAAPAPVYAAPPPGYYYAPEYAYPPVVGSFNLGFGFGGGDHDRGGRRWR
jgi:hypothetical protein